MGFARYGPYANYNELRAGFAQAWAGGRERNRAPGTSDLSACDRRLPWHRALHRATRHPRRRCSRRTQIRAAARMFEVSMQDAVGKHDRVALREPPRLVIAMPRRATQMGQGIPARLILRAGGHKDYLSSTRKQRLWPAMVEGRWSAPSGRRSRFKHARWLGNRQELKRDHRGVDGPTEQARGHASAGRKRGAVRCLQDTGAKVLARPALKARELCVEIDTGSGNYKDRRWPVKMSGFPPRRRPPLLGSIPAL